MIRQLATTRFLAPTGIAGILLAIFMISWHIGGVKSALYLIACCAIGWGLGRFINTQTADDPNEYSTGKERYYATKNHLGAIFDLLTGHNLQHAHRCNIGGRPCYVCARCSGALSGAVLSSIIFATGLLTAWPYSYVVTVLALPLLLDWITQTLGLRQSTNQLRFVTGALAGVALALFGIQATEKEKIHLMMVIFAIILGTHNMAIITRKLCAMEFRQ